MAERNDSVNEVAYGIYGTSQLIASDGHGDRKDIVLVPHPTSDPNDPLNWTYPKKLLTIFGIMCFAFFCGVVVTGPIAAWTYTIEDIGITETQLNYALAINLLGLGFGNVGYTLISAQLGRRTVYLIASLGGICTSIWTAVYDLSGSNYARSLILGFLLAPYEGMTMTIAGDLFFLHERGTYMAVIFLCALLGTDLGTIMDGYIASSPISYIDWRWTGWIPTIGFGFTFLVIFFFFEETRYLRSSHTQPYTATRVDNEDNSEEILQKEGMSAPQSDTRVENSHPTRKGWLQRMAPWQILPRTSRKSTWELLKEICVLSTYPAVLWAGCVYGVNLAWFACILSMLAVVIFEPPFNFTASAFGLTRVGTITGSILALIIAGPLSDRIATALARRRGGIREAEDRLPLFFAALVFMPGALLIFGFAAYYKTHWMGPVFGEAMTSFSYAFASELAMSYVVDCYRPVAVEAFVGIVVIRNLWGFGFTFAISPWLAASNVRDVCIVLAVVTIVVYATTIPLYIYGKRLRIWTSQRFPLAGREVL
ncbi:hypothetical protein LTS17_001395 [Exophiala oligosperma]